MQPPLRKGSCSLSQECGEGRAGPAPTWGTAPWTILLATASEAFDSYASMCVMSTMWSPTLGTKPEHGEPSLASSHMWSPLCQPPAGDFTACLPGQPLTQTLQGCLVVDTHTATPPCALQRSMLQDCRPGGFTYCSHIHASVVLMGFQIKMTGQTLAFTWIQSRTPAKKIVKEFLKGKKQNSKENVK